MSGETNLKTLLGSMRPELQPETYVFVTLPLDQSLPEGVPPLMVFGEKEGWTCIVSEEAAGRAGLSGTFPSRMITLSIHSSLEAVGFLAAILPRLAAAGMGVNPVSGFYHDHLFVPADRAGDAMRILEELAVANRN
ncbi:ACT domain-containing protein [Mesorhizobium amorphae]|uniref:ACT domain-containing protein n=1 Tax=Mesorhizobium amorphae TaxID=71433 RepID=UPI0011860E48|nr:ACT domain-containing protein [Mesorhizobium amorphae]